MPQHRLHRAQIGAALEEVTREGVTERVGRHGGADPGPPRGLLEDAPQGLAGQRPAEAVHEERPCLGALHQDRARGLEVQAHPAKRLRPHRHQALAAPLAGRHDVAGGQIDVLDAEAERLGRAEAGGIQQLEQRAVAKPVRPADVGRLDQRDHVLHGQRARQAPGGPGSVQVLRRVARDHAGLEEVTIESAHRREMSGDAAAAEASPPQPAHVPCHLGGSRLPEAAPLPAEEVAKTLQVAAVGQERIGGGPPLHLEGPEKLGHRVHQGVEAGRTRADPGADTATPQQRPIRTVTATTGALATNPRRIAKSIIRLRRKASSVPGVAACRAARGARAHAGRRPRRRTRARRSRAR